MISGMLTLPLIEPPTLTSVLVVVDPCDELLVHAHSRCVELIAVVDLIERCAGTAVDDPDELDAAIAELGLGLTLEAAVGLRTCPSCWGE